MVFPLNMYNLAHGLDGDQETLQQGSLSGCHKCRSSCGVYPSRVGHSSPAGEVEWFPPSFLDEQN